MVVTMLGAVFGLGLVMFLVTYMCYIVVMVANSVIEECDDSLVKLFAYAVGAPFAVVGWPLDVAFNWTYGLVLGVTDHLTLSGKLQYLRRVDRGEKPDVHGIARPWRVAVANFVCEQLLNPFEKDGHC